MSVGSGSRSLAAAYSATGGAWARGPELVYAAMATALVERSPVPLAGRSIVDIGAGTGAGGRAASAAGAASVVAVDAAVGMLRHDAAARPPAAVGDLLALPFSDGAFGGAVASFSLNHVPSPASGLREMARVVGRGGPLLASAYAADDTHPVKAAVEDALRSAGWTAPAWYEEVRTKTTPKLATVTACEEAIASSGIEARVLEVRVPLAGLSPLDLVAWRLGMAQCAPFAAGLDPPSREAVVAEALDRLGPSPAPLVRSVLVIAGLSR